MGSGIAGPNVDLRVENPTTRKKPLRELWRAEGGLTVWWEGPKIPLCVEAGNNIPPRMNLDRTQHQLSYLRTAQVRVSHPSYSAPIYTRNPNRHEY